MASLPPVRSKVGADVTGFTQGIGSAVSALGGFKGALGAAGVGLAAFAGAKGIGAAVSAFSSFDEKMTESQAIMDELSQETMADMERAALDVSRTTLKSADEAAESYFFLASAGLDAEQSIAALPQVAEFAQAGMFDMATATDLATDAQSALGLTVEDSTQNLRNLTRVTDVFVRANQLANATVQQFSEALTNKLGPRLRILNKDIEEGVAGLAALADQGLKGRKAGRGLAIVLRDLSSQAVKNASGFEELGIRVFDAEGNMRNLSKIVADFEAVLGDASDQQKTAALETLGINKRAQGFLLTLIGLSDELAEYEGELRDAQGATGEVADKQVDTLSRQMELLGSEIGAATISLGGFIAEGLNLKENAGLIRAGIENIREGLQGFSDDVADAFGDDTADRIETTLEGMEFRFGIDKDETQEQIAGLADALSEEVRPIFAAQVESALEEVEAGKIAGEDLNRVISERARMLARNEATRRRSREETEQETDDLTAREKELRKQREQATKRQNALAEARRKVAAEELGISTILLSRERERLNTLVEEGAEWEKIVDQAEKVAKLESEIARKRAAGEGIAEIDVESPDVEPVLDEGAISPPELEEREPPPPPEVEGQDLVDPDLLGENGAMAELDEILRNAALPALDEFAGELGIGTSALANFVDSILSSLGDALSGKEGGLGFLGEALSSFAGGFQGGGRIPVGQVGLVHAGETLVRGPANVQPAGGGGTTKINVKTEIRALDAKGVDRVIREGGQQAVVDAVLRATRHRRDVSEAIVSGSG